MHPFGIRLPPAIIALAGVAAFAYGLVRGSTGTLIVGVLLVVVAAARWFFG